MWVLLPLLFLFPFVWNSFFHPCTFNLIFYIFVFCFIDFLALTFIISFLLFVLDLICSSFSHFFYFFLLQSFYFFAWNSNYTYGKLLDTAFQLLSAVFCALYCIHFLSFSLSVFPDISSTYLYKIFYMTLLVSIFLMKFLKSPCKCTFSTRSLNINHSYFKVSVWWLQLLGHL